MAVTGYAVVRGGLIVNVIAVDPEQHDPGLFVGEGGGDVVPLDDLTPGAGLGWTVDGDTATPPAPPEAATPVEVRVAALEDAVDGLLLDALMGA